MSLNRLSLGAVVLLALTGSSVTKAVQPEPPAPAKPSVPVPPTADELKAAVATGIDVLLSLQEGEGDAKSQWAYEGVYRVRNQIPEGYRVGGTAITAIALLRAPGYAEDDRRKAAVARAADFIAAHRSHVLMGTANYDGGYDVRAWGYIYAIQFFSVMKRDGLTPEGKADACDEACRWYIDALQALEMPETGGWNYARPEGKATVGTPSPFMTGPALQALFEAKAAGYAVDEAVVNRALDVLDKGRIASGAINYAIDPRRTDLVPGAMGRMLATESTLLLAGRSSVANVRSALDAFFTHWRWFEARRQKTGTHVAPYGVAPYYFMYAHEAAARAIEQLPPRERTAYRAMLAERLFAVRDADGSWNDRVFRRSAAYGTACAITALLAKDAPAPAGWGNK